MLPLTIIPQSPEDDTVARQSNYAINSAIRLCLAHCRQSDDPLASLSETLDELRDRLWREADVRAVEHAARKVLVRVFATRYVESYEEPCELV